MLKAYVCKAFSSAKVRVVFLLRKCNTEKLCYYFQTCPMHCSHCSEIWKTSFNITKGFLNIENNLNLTLHSGWSGCRGISKVFNIVITLDTYQFWLELNTLFKNGKPVHFSFLWTRMKYVIVGHSSDVCFRSFHVWST